MGRAAASAGETRACASREGAGGGWVTGRVGFSRSAFNTGQRIPSRGGPQRLGRGGWAQGATKGQGAYRRSPAGGHVWRIAGTAARAGGGQRGRGQQTGKEGGVLYRRGQRAVVRACCSMRASSQRHSLLCQRAALASVAAAALLRRRLPGRRRRCRCCCDAAGMLLHIKVKPHRQGAAAEGAHKRSSGGAGRAPDASRGLAALGRAALCGRRLLGEGRRRLGGRGGRAHWHWQGGAGGKGGGLHRRRRRVRQAGRGFSAGPHSHGRRRLCRALLPLRRRVGHRLRALQDKGACREHSLGQQAGVCGKHCRRATFITP